MDRNILVFDGDATRMSFTKRLLCQMKTVFRRHQYIQHSNKEVIRYLFLDYDDAQEFLDENMINGVKVCNVELVGVNGKLMTDYFVNQGCKLASYDERLVLAIGEYDTTLLGSYKCEF